MTPVLNGLLGELVVKVVAAAATQLVVGRGDGSRETAATLGSTFGRSGGTAGWSRSSRRRRARASPAVPSSHWNSPSSTPSPSRRRGRRRSPWLSPGAPSCPSPCSPSSGSGGPDPSTGTTPRPRRLPPAVRDRAGRLDTVDVSHPRSFQGRLDRADRPGARTGVTPAETTGYPAGAEPTRTPLRPDTRVSIAAADTGSMAPRPQRIAATGRYHLYAHWPVAPEALRASVPDPLTLDTYDGSAGLGITPFLMSGLRPRRLPARVGISFPELHLRTYVRHGGTPGVFLFGLDIGNRLVAALARRVSGVPYHPAAATVRPVGIEVRYASRRRGDERVRFAATDRQRSRAGPTPTPSSAGSPPATGCTVARSTGRWSGRTSRSGPELRPARATIPRTRWRRSRASRSTTPLLDYDQRLHYPGALELTTSMATPDRRSRRPDAVIRAACRTGSGRARSGRIGSDRVVADEVGSS